MNNNTSRMVLALLCLVLMAFAIVMAACGSQPASEPAKAVTAPPQASIPTLESGDERIVSGGNASPLGITATPKPTTSPRPTQSVEPGSLSRLALSMQYDRSIAPLDRDGDLAFVIYNQGLRPAQLASLSSAPKSSRMLVFTSTEGIEEVLDKLSIEISYIGYDLERWEQTPVWEQEHPVEAVQKMQKVAHSRGLKLFIVPTIPFNERYGKQLALYTDIYAPQAKAYQASLPPEEYNRVVRKWFEDFKQANPQVKLYLDLSVNPKGVKKTPSQLLEDVIAVQDLIQGISIYHRRDEAETVREFVKLLGR